MGRVKTQIHRPTGLVGVWVRVWEGVGVRVGVGVWLRVRVKCVCC